jgi:hypothetical protein
MRPEHGAPGALPGLTAVARGHDDEEVSHAGRRRAVATAERGSSYGAGRGQAADAGERRRSGRCVAGDGVACVNGLPVTRASEESVRRAIEERGYVPNHAARTLMTRRTDLIALVVPEPTTRVFSADRFFAGVVQGVSQELEAGDKQLVLMLAGSEADRQRI